MSKRTLNSIGYPFILVLGLFAYCMLISLADSRIETRHHQMGEDLIEVKYGELVLDQCPDCQGIWFDDGEMEYLLDSLNLTCAGISEHDLLQQPRVDTDEDLRPCPVCCSCMIKAAIDGNAGLLVDVCPHGDGLWFEGGECEAMIDELCNTRSGWPVAGLSVLASFQALGFLMLE